MAISPYNQNSVYAAWQAKQNIQPTNQQQNPDHDPLRYINEAINRGQISRERNVGAELGRDQFLQLLVVQMRNQDPLDPVSNTEFISQMANFSALEQMQQLNTAMSMSNMFMLEMLSNQILAESVSFIGKYVHAVRPETDDTPEEVIEGVVDKVRLVGGIPHLVIGDREIPAAFVVWVSNRPPAAPPPAETPEPDYDAGDAVDGNNQYQYTNQYGN